MGKKQLMAVTSNSTKKGLVAVVIIVLMVVIILYSPTRETLIGKPTLTGQCIGMVPLFSKLCRFDGTNVIGDMPRILVSACTSARKCEYTCKSGFYFDSALNRCTKVCDTNNECPSGSVCGLDDAGTGYDVCELPNQPLGTACDSNTECASGVCGHVAGSGSTWLSGSNVCEEGDNPLDSACLATCEEGTSGVCRRREGNYAQTDCASGLVCGYAGIPEGYICEEPNEVGDRCGNDDECLSNLCISGYCAGGLLPVGATCFVDEDCASGDCSDGFIYNHCE